MRWLTRLQLKSKDPEERQEAVQRLSHSAGGKEIRSFAQALLDENMNVRRAAAKAISSISPSAVPKCIERLYPLLNDSDFILRKCSALALKQLLWEPATPEDRVLYQIALGEFDDIEAEESSVEPLLGALKIGPIAVRVNAARTFERLQNRMQDPRISGPLIRTLNDSEPSLRAAAAHALGNNSTDDQKISPLLKLFKDSAAIVRAAAAEAVGKSGKPEYIPHYLPLLKDENFEVRIATIKALREMNSPEALEPIISTLKDSDTDVRKCAVESLTKLRDPRSVPALMMTLIDKESVVRHAVANALQVINCDWQICDEAQKAIPYFEAALKDDEYWVREAAGKALYRIRNL